MSIAFQPPRVLAFQRASIKKGTGHHLGPNLVILREHGFNSSAAPPVAQSAMKAGLPMAP